MNTPEDSICKAAVKDMDIPAYPKSQGEATKKISGGLSEELPYKQTSIK